jgi:arylsulfatase A-like enzyme
MRQRLALLLMILPAASLAAPRPSAGQRPSALQRPNIIFMLSDDQGWSGLSVAMHPDVPASKGEIFHTPCLEKLAAQGMRFSAAYAPAPVCSPTRISLQTGKSPAQLHWTKAAPPEQGRRLIEPQLIKSIAADQTTYGELLRKAGYATAHYGKWHISGGGPGPHGYDEHDGDTGNENAYQFTDPNPVDIFGMAERASAFMEKNSKAKKPFFIQLSWNALHAPENANKATMAKYANLSIAKNPKQAATAAITEDLDTGVGKVIEAIDRLGLIENTYVIYMADNGAGGAKRGGLRGGKGGVWEGGIRVPLIIRGPGVKPNSWCHTPVVGYDFFPTFCEWAGISASMLPKGIEGGSIESLLANDGQGIVHRPREELVFHFPHYQGEDGPQSSIRLGSLKLMWFYEDNRVALFDLSNDISESNNLSWQMPAETGQLRDRLQKYLTAVDAQFPTPNPQFDPSRPVVPNREKKGGGGGMQAKKGMKRKPVP